jgi:protein tyrosine phosphatase (PTP) superfamily phosphohydrolase (DUF442 family)
MTETVHDILNYLPISEEIGTAGQPTPGQFAAIRAAGYQAVVNLAMPNSSNALADERELVAGQGLEYVHIPVVWECPTQDDLAQFFATLDRYRGRRLLVHCALNMRVSVFVLLYRVIRQGIPWEPAMADVRRIWEPDPVWQAFIAASLAHHAHAASQGQAGARQNTP